MTLQVELQLNQLKRKILSYTQIDEEFLVNQLQQYELFELKKGETLVTPNQQMNHFYYLASGCMCYYKMEDGEMKVLEFYTEDVFFTDLISYVNEVPSTHYLKAVEPTIVFGIAKADAERLFTASHQLERFGRLSMHFLEPSDYSKLAFYLSYLSHSV